MISGAYFSVCKKYRYSLWRFWGVKQRIRDCCFIMLNPSTADDQQDDPTIHRCIALAKSWKCSGLTVVNLFALRSTDPKKLKAARDPVGPLNDEVILNAARNCHLVVCAWGNGGDLYNRGRLVLELLQNNKIEAYAMEVTKHAQPKHPLYIRGDSKPVVVMSSNKKAVTRKTTR